MSKGTDGTRREFLIRLAKAAAFVPPAMASVDVRPLYARVQGGGKSTTSTASSTSSTTIGSISPTSQQIDNSQFNIDGGATPSTQSAPWDTRQPSRPPPWSRPPPSGS